MFWYMSQALARTQQADQDYDEWERKEKARRARAGQGQSRLGKPVASERRRARVRFDTSPEWEAARAICLERMGRICAKCGADKQIQVDHIKPKSKFQELALEQSNLRPLCWPCNKAKAAKLE